MLPIRHVKGTKRHPKDTQKTPEMYPRGTQKASKSHPKATQKPPKNNKKTSTFFLTLVGQNVY